MIRRQTLRAMMATAPAVAMLTLTGCALAEQPADPPVATVTFAGVNPDRTDYLLATGTVTGISETGGKCVFTFWAKTGVATRLSGEGRVEGDHTVCGPVDEPLGFMVGVNYEVTLTYVARSGESFESEKLPMTLPRPGSS